MRSLRVLLGSALALTAVPLLMASPAPASAPVPTLVDIRSAHADGVDRVVFEFQGGLPDTRVRYVDRLIADGSGLPVRVAGRAVLQVRFEPADAHDADGPTAARRRAFALPNVITAVRAGDFEAVTTYGLGLAKRTAVTVRTRSGPDRVVVEVKAGFPTLDRRVWFLDEDRFVDNIEPYFVPRGRLLRAAMPATSALDRLFAGPLPTERRTGLRLVRSEARSFTDLEITDGVARVRLLGGCDSRGSTVTIAGSLMPTLRQFPTVDWVKVYGPGGHTADPTGPSDSIPDCLNP